MKPQVGPHRVAAGEHERHAEQGLDGQQGQPARRAGSLHHDQVGSAPAHLFEQSDRRAQLVGAIERELGRRERLQQHPDALALDVPVPLRREADHAAVIVRACRAAQHGATHTTGPRLLAR